MAKRPAKPKWIVSQIKLQVGPTRRTGSFLKPDRKPAPKGKP